MSRVLLLVTLLFVVASCDSDDPPSSPEQIDIRDVDWFPGNTQVGALVWLPDKGTTVFRIYDLSGNISLEIPLVNDQFARQLHVAEDGQHAVFKSSNIVYVLDIAAKAINHAFNVSAPISAAPDHDVFLLNRAEDNLHKTADTAFLDSNIVFARARLKGGSLVIDTFLRYTRTGFRISTEFPALLAGGRVASIEDSAGSTQLRIRDSVFAETHIFNLPMATALQDIRVPRNDNSFFFVTFSGIKQVNKFRTDLGFIDPIEKVFKREGYYNDISRFAFYDVLSSGEGVIFRRTESDYYIFKNILTSEEKVIPNTDKGSAVFVSPNDKLLAVVMETDAGHKLSVVTLP